MIDLNSIKKSISKRKLTGNSLRQTSEKIIEKYRFTKRDKQILIIALKYHKVKATYLKLPKYSYPLKYKTDPRKQKTWIHFSRILDTFEELEIDAIDYFDYQFRKFKNNKNNLAVWFIYSESSTNEYLRYKAEAKEAGISRKILKNPKEELKEKIEFAGDYVKKIMANRKCTEKQFWSDIIIGDQIKIFPNEFLKNNKTYIELYKQGYYKGLNFYNPLI